MTDAYSPSRTIRQTDIPGLAAAGLIGDYPVALRTPRALSAGGFADQARYPNTWTVYFLVEGEWALVQSARGLRREWNSLDRLEAWLRGLGFRYFWVRNEIDIAEPEAEEPAQTPAEEPGPA